MKRIRRFFVSRINLFRYSYKKFLYGIEVANLFIQRIDKFSLLFILKKNGANIGTDCDIQSGQVFHNCRDYSNLKIGNNCHIGKNCFFDLRNKIVIGHNSVISMKCSVITHIDLSNSDLCKFYPKTSSQVLIGSNCYIGVNSTVLMGVSVNDYSFIAAGSIVTNNVKSYTLVGGSPAKFIKNIE